MRSAWKVCSQHSGIIIRSVSYVYSAAVETAPEIADIQWGRSVERWRISASSRRTIRVLRKTRTIIKDIEVGLAKTDGTYLVIPDRREAIFYAIRNAEEGDMIAIIGKGHEDYQEIEGVKHHFLDREVVEEAVKG